MTKNQIKAELKLAINLAEQCRNVTNDLISSLTESYDDDLFDLMDEISCGNATNVNEIMSRLEGDGYFDDTKITEDGDEIITPVIEISDIVDVTVKIPTNLNTITVKDLGSNDTDIQISNDYLVASITSTDNATPQVSILFETNDNQIDIAMAEIKHGELAEIDGKTPGNKDIDLYCYTDPYTEDWQRKDTIKYDEVKDAVDN